ncbi:glycosyl hydrolase 2 galactose-binding domain-containing protein [Nonomuraea polychroma]|uniref:glycosyl hydrolase 2 galactose-binding domain-containing protein n=1 Tax=Nonomuraea polychroma TaxID=46176 RepID=UPI003D94AC63
MTYRPLHDGWTLSSQDITGVAASVPGCVHTDLLAAGIIDDPYLDDHATIELNGVRVASTANQHRSYRFPVRHLLPGENAVFHVTTSRDLDAEALTGFPVLRCVNEAVRP